MLVRNVVIDDNRHVANTDGVDLSGCSHVEVDHCFSPARMMACADVSERIRKATDTLADTAKTVREEISLPAYGSCFLPWQVDKTVKMNRIVA